MKISVSFSESDVSAMVQTYLSSQNIGLTSEATKEVVAKLTEALKDMKLDAESLAKFTINTPLNKPYTTFPGIAPHQPSPFWYGPPTSQLLAGVGGSAGSGIYVGGKRYNND